ncbi:32609_t:CDS:2, partial [Racocetra persica]
QKLIKTCTTYNINTTNIVGHHQLANNINETICSLILTTDAEIDLLAINTINRSQLQTNQTEDIKQIYQHAYISNTHASKTQYPLQGLTLPHATIWLDKQIFAYEQAYVAISQTKSLSSLDIRALDKFAI